MDLERVRRQWATGTLSLRIAVHSKVEARKDGLTEDDIETALEQGEVIEDYGNRVLVLAWAENGTLPYHVVFEDALTRREVVAVSAYMPDAALWNRDWKTRRRRSR